MVGEKKIFAWKELALVRFLYVCFGLVVPNFFKSHFFKNVMEKTKNKLKKASFHNQNWSSQATQSSIYKKIARTTFSLNYCWHEMISYDHQYNTQWYRLFAVSTEEKIFSSIILRSFILSLCFFIKNSTRHRVEFESDGNSFFIFFSDAFRVENSMKESMWNHVAAVKNISL